MSKMQLNYHVCLVEFSDCYKYYCYSNVVKQIFLLFNLLEF